MRKYFLITNVSGMKYWSYLGTKYNTGGLDLKMVKKYGEIYINQHGGWMTKDCIKKIHETVTQMDFPTWGLDKP